MGGDTETKCGAETEGKAIQRLPHLVIHPIYSQQTQGITSEMKKKKITNKNRKIETEAVVLAIGHSARDTIEKFLENLYPKTVIDFQPIKLWILTRYEIGCNFREKCKCFISAALSTEDPGYRFGFWQQSMNRFGGPNVVNGQGELLHGAYLNGSPVDLEYILAPMAISQLFDCTGSYRKKTCPLLEICCRSVEKTCYSEICSSDPRKRILKTP